MKVLLDIKESKVGFVVELLKSFSFVKTQPLTPYKAEVLEGIKDAVKEMQLIKSGKLKSIPAKKLLNEL